MPTARPNDRCPCGSGRNYKKCCAKKRRGRRDPASEPRYTKADREEALRKLDALLHEVVDEEELNDLAEEFWGGVPVPEDPQLLEMSHFAFQAWSYFDVDLGDRETLADIALQEPGLLAPRERAFVERGRQAAMRLYEVVDVRPGASLSLRDLFDGSVQEVRERAGSRALHRWDVIAARIFLPGASGRPELDGGMFTLSPARRDDVFGQATRHLEACRAELGALSERMHHALLAPLYHQAWLTPPSIPKLVNYDGHELVETSVYYDVTAGSGPTLCPLLDAIPEFERPEVSELETRWTWSGIGTDRVEPVVRGWLELRDERLVLHTNSCERAELGRTLLEGALGDLVSYRCTESSDSRSALQRQLASRDRASHDDAAPDREELPAELREPATAALEAYYQSHYEKWIDEPVPMFEGNTPREAAASPELRTRVQQALKDLERMYESALEAGQPGFDPWWLREELGIFEEGAAVGAHPAPLAHETVADLMPALPAVATQIADRVRAQSEGALDRVVEAEDLALDLGLERLVRDHRRAVATDADSETATSHDGLLRAYVELLANFELHRRKVFWVSDPLSWALGATRLDAGGDLLKPPFASFALVFTDRYALGLAEKMLSREPQARLRGRMLRVLTVYVTRARDHGASSTLRVTLACDALDGDWPYLVARNLKISDDRRIDEILAQSWPDALHDELDSLHDCVPLRDLLHLVMSAVLYATSAGARTEERPARTRRASARASRPTFSSENVYYLPGTIDISALRAIQRARRGAGDRAQIHRCLVRGHWRRANPSWKEDRPRWIEPYWRGPSIAAIVERQYRLQPSAPRSS